VGLDPRYRHDNAGGVANERSSQPAFSPLALAAVGTTVLLWGSAFVGIRAAAPHFSPGSLALGRLIAAAVTLGIVCAVRRAGWPQRTAWPAIAVCGLLWLGAYMVLLNWGERSVDAGTASMIVGVGPILIAVLSGWLLREGFPRMLFAGIAVSFIGVVVTGLATSDRAGSSVGGVLLCVLAAVAFAGGMVTQKRALRQATALQVTTFGCVVALVACLPFAGQLTTEVAHAPVSATLNMIFLGVFPTALAFTTWAYALARMPAGQLGVTTYIVPVVAILLSWTILGEVPTWLAMVGGLLCVAGVAVARRPAPTRNAAGPDGSAEPVPAAAQPVPDQS
jgi:drug/metabolite transporter (DMT)-like permease